MIKTYPLQQNVKLRRKEPNVGRLCKCLSTDLFHRAAKLIYLSHKTKPYH